MRTDKMTYTALIQVRKKCTYSMLSTARVFDLFERRECRAANHYVLVIVYHAQVLCTVLLHTMLPPNTPLKI